MKVSTPKDDNAPEARAAQIEDACKYYKYYYQYYNIGFAARTYLKLEGEQVKELGKVITKHKSEDSHEHGLLGRLVSDARGVLADIDDDFKDVSVQTWTDGYPMVVAKEFIHTAIKYVVNRAESWAARLGYEHKEIKKTGDKARKEIKHKLKDLLAKNPSRSRVLKCITEFAQKYSVDSKELTLADYESMFQTIKMPAIARDWDQDWAFAYQTVAGSVPNKIQCIDEIPGNFPVTEEIYRKAMGQASNLAEDLKHKRVFLLDFTLFDRYSGGMSYGRQKYIYAPMALFAWRDTDEHNGFGLTPVAIQCGKDPEKYPIFTPDDGWRWKMARYCVAVATGTYRGGYLHFALHIIIERVLIALKRTLALKHPLHVLLNANFALTMSANTTTMTFIEEPDGYSVHLMPCWVHATVEQQLSGVSAFRFDRSAPPRMFELQGLADPDVLPIYPFREDTTKIWNTILEFVTGYIGLYYADDGEVVADHELQNWIKDLQAPDGARLKGVGSAGKVETVAALTQFIAQLMYQTSAFHAAVNYSGFDCISFPPSGGYAGFGAPPTRETPDVEASFLAMLPPMEYAWTQFLVEMDQMTSWANEVGVYREDYFHDERVKPLADAFQARMNTIAEEITAANKERPLPYVHQCPPNVTASIQC